MVHVVLTYPLLMSEMVAMPFLIPAQANTRSLNLGVSYMDIVHCLSIQIGA